MYLCHSLAHVVFKLTVELGQHGNVVGCAVFAIANAFAFVAQAFFHLPCKVCAVDQLHLASARSPLAVGDYPYIGVDASVVKKLVGQTNHGFQHVVFNDPAADVAFAAACVAGKEWRAIKNNGDA